VAVVQADGAPTSANGAKAVVAKLVAAGSTVARLALAVAKTSAEVFLTANSSVLLT
jgi:hypothetical protein